MLAVIATAALSQRPQAQAAQEPATVEGVVTNAVTGEPVLRARVQLQSFGPAPGRYGALTDAQGRFSIKGLPPANYSITAERVGFVSIGNRPEDRVMLKAGENRRDLNVKLTPTGAISGRVTGAGGEPAEFIGVQAVEGESVAMSMSATTDEKGQFRLGGLRPGKYRIRTAPIQPPLPPEIRTDGTAETHYVPTYYPNSTERKSGARVQVLAGRETSGIEVALVQMPIICVSGRVSGIPPGAEGVHVSAQAPGGYGGQARVRADGTFQVWRPIPGRNILIASWRRPDGEEFQSPPVDIDVGAADIENIELVMIPPFDISGRLQIEDAPAQDPAGASRRPGPVRRPMLGLEPLDRMGSPVRPTEVSADGSFKWEKVPPRRFRVALYGVPGYVRAMRLGEVDIDGPVLDVRYGPGAAELTVFVSTAMGELSGTVRDENGNPVAAIVGLLSDDAGDFRRWPSSLAESDDKGAYRLGGVVPGRYRIVVRRPSPSYSGSWSSGDGEDDAETIEIRANEKLTKDLTLRPAEDQ